ncbi:MAG: helicase HerA-like domain-containing protein [Gammaproteobacteria bacterium]
MPQALQLRFANRHGLVAGATGTGKTVTLQVLAEGFSRAGVPVFMADVKGDLSGMALPGATDPRLQARAAQIGLSGYAGESFPVVYWDLFGRQGHPVRTTVTDMGPLLLARVLEVNETQEGVLNVLFKLADDEGLLLLDLKDLRAMLAEVADRAGELGRTYGNVSPASVGAIQRRLLVLEQQGGAGFFGEPALDLEDFMQTDARGRGRVNLLAAAELIRSPRLYATFLLWLLSELFERLPEVGDLDRPRLVFFFDEAHLLFADAPKALVARIEQVVRLVRSKGVGVYFITQNPLDLPDAVLGQLGNRIQHALRAFTPADQKAVRAAAQTFRPNPRLDVQAAITELAVGEALVSTLGEGGVPTPVERILIRPPCGRIGPATLAERQDAIAASPIAGRYERVLDRVSAFEMLRERAAAVPGPSQAPPAAQREAPARAASRGGRQSVAEAFAKSVVRTVGSSLGRQIVRGILGAILRGR